MPGSSPRLKAATTMYTNTNDDGDEPAEASTPPLKDDVMEDAAISKKKAVKKLKGARKKTTAKKGATKRKKAASNDDDTMSDTEDSTVSSSSSSKASPKKKTKKSKGTKKATARAKTKKEDKENVTMDEAADNDSDSEEEDGSAPQKSKKKRVTKKRKTAKKKATAKSDNDAEASGDASGSDSDDDASSTTSSKSKKKKTKTTKRKKKAKTPVQSITERDELPKLWNDEMANANGSYTLKIATWNVAGLRAILKKDPEALAKLVSEHKIDVLCLQETKLQVMHLDDPKLQLRGHLLEAEGYDAYYSCSTERKGYAGTAVFVKRRGTAKAVAATTEEDSSNKKKQQTDITSFFGKKEKKETDDSKRKDDDESSSDALPVDAKLLMPEKVSYGLGMEKHDAEGRVIVLDFPGFTMANLYVPNSGQKLDRLSYRTDEWDKDLVSYMQTKQTQRGKPVMWLGDLNVAHKEYEAYNFGAKHLDQQAGLTPQERASFTTQLEAGFVDAFRHLHPTAKGHYTYWSQRAGNREPNKGLRLDYFVCDPTFFDDKAKVVARDSYMIPDQLGSDHCPAVLELEIKL